MPRVQGVFMEVLTSDLKNLQRCVEKTAELVAVVNSVPGCKAYCVKNIRIFDRDTGSAQLDITLDFRREQHNEGTP
jgi:hypothetical protein